MGYSSRVIGCQLTEHTEDVEPNEYDAKLLKEATYVVRKAEMTDILGTERPWEEQEDEPLTLADFRRLEPGSDEREIVICHLLVDIWNELDHLRHHVCPYDELGEDEELEEEEGE